MFEPIFESYRQVLESSLRVQESMYRRWINGVPAGPEVAEPLGPSEVLESPGSYQERWTKALTDLMEHHRHALDAQYRTGIEAIESAFCTAEARTPEEYWRLTQEFWRKSIDAYKTTLEAQGKYLQNLASMWFDVLNRDRE
ncbi:hypothetical protein OJF2_55050 [Aquisphaera giovannonii]|uniref:Phasin protein n=1 Tax=Aquisphaera giovannonii TaxID=406548 RepID=A0A5B9WAL2_9BACT|nr:hypothetical protein [Aquisphaera giovannonii]QEH36920.1 hypothetical protein OJF2_55050 [Aquisphaera giovannonii]